MSQDSRYQFHMGCGESLHSQWWSAGLMAAAMRKGRHPGRDKTIAAHRKPRGGRKE